MHICDCRFLFRKKENKCQLCIHPHLAATKLRVVSGIVNVFDATFNVQMHVAGLGGANSGDLKKNADTPRFLLHRPACMVLAMTCTQ